MSSNRPEPTIRQYMNADWEAVHDICIAAFTPIHEGFERALGRELFLLVYPDWKASNESYLRSLCDTNERQRILVAEIDGSVVGFIHYELKRDKRSGKLGLNAVHPSWQRRGVAAKLYARVFEVLLAEGMRFVQVGTGGDEAHIPARGAYEKSGFTPIPVVHYFKKL
jgi:GNAT superfamily N-acetyltransferase